MSRLYLQKYVNNNKQSKAYGKTFGRLKATETLNLSDLCRHIQKHGSIFTPDVVKGVTEKFITCIQELLLEGNKVKLDGLGTFYLSVSTVGEQDPDDFTAQNVKKVRIKFLGDRSKESDYATVMLTRVASFRILGENTTDSGSGGSDGGTGTDTPEEDRP